MAAEPHGGESSLAGAVGHWEDWQLTACVWLTGESRFEEIRRSNQAAAERLAENQLSSSSSEDEEDGSPEHQDRRRGQILESAFTCYTSQTGDTSPHASPGPRRGSPAAGQRSRPLSAVCRR